MNRRILWDCHMHSSFSADSPTPMEDMIRQAVSLGLQGITFTEHLDPDYPATPDGLDFSLDIPSYQEKLFQLQDTYKDKIQIRFGIELGLQMHLADYFHSLMQEFPFDFAIGSSHLVHGFDPYYPEFFQGRKESRCYMEYFESILENLSCCKDFDVYGHIDYIVRYGSNKNREYSYGPLQRHSGRNPEKTYLHGKRNRAEYWRLPLWSGRAQSLRGNYPKIQGTWGRDHHHRC